MPVSSKSTGRRGQVGLASTLVNFPVVFAGLVAITTQTSGNDEIAMLNMWAAWGILQGLLGQVGLISGVLDPKRWNDAAVLKLAAAFALGAGALAFVLRSQLFPDHANWWVAVPVLAAAVFIIGRQRAELTAAGAAVSTLVIAAVENCLRSALVAIVVFAEAVELGAEAIVAPFALSFVILERTIVRTDRTRSSDFGTFDSVSKGVLAGFPALAAYALIPGVTLLEATENLDRLALAATLLRGPLLVATFVAPWILERSLGRGAVGLILLGWAMVAVTLGQVVVVAALELGSIGELVVNTVLSGVVACVTYASILLNADRLPSTRGAALAIGVAAGVFVVVLNAATSIDFLHPFVALSASCAILLPAIDLS